MTWPIGKLDSVRFDSSLYVKILRKCEGGKGPVDWWTETHSRARSRLASRRVHAEGFARNA